MATLIEKVTNLLPSAAVSYPEDRTATVGTYFSGAVGANTLLSQAQSQLAELGFQKDNSIREPRSTHARSYLFARTAGYVHLIADAGLSLYGHIKNVFELALQRLRIAVLTSEL